MKGFAAFGFIVSVVIAVALTAVAAAPNTGLSKGVGIALMLGMLVATWAAIAAAITYVLESRQPGSL